jgi:hypothetical protein
MPTYMLLNTHNVYSVRADSAVSCKVAIGEIHTSSVAFVAPSRYLMNTLQYFRVRIREVTASVLTFKLCTPNDRIEVAMHLRCFTIAFHCM